MWGRCHIKAFGTPLPDWEFIEEEPEVDLRGILDQKKKKRERKEASTEWASWLLIMTVRGA